MFLTVYKCCGSIYSILGFISVASGVLSNIIATFLMSFLRWNRNSFEISRPSEKCFFQFQWLVYFHWVQSICGPGVYEMCQFLDDPKNKALNLIYFWPNRDSTLYSSVILRCLDLNTVTLITEINTLEWMCASFHTKTLRCMLFPLNGSWLLAKFY